MIRTDNIGTQMMAKRLQNSAESTDAKARQIYEYYSKWERGLANEIAQFV